MSSILRAESIRKSFQREEEEILLFEQLNFDVSTGETVSITGASGCGKSTLLFLLAGLDKPDSGSIFWQNKNISLMNETDRSLFRGQMLGFVFQFHHLLPEFTALENVMMPALIQGKSTEEAIALAEPLLDKLGVMKRKNHRPSELSGGEQQRISFARALVNRPPIIFADEPTGNLDEKNAQILQSIMHEVVQEFQVSFVLVTHDNSVAKSCSTQFHLSAGQLERLQ